MILFFYFMTFIALFCIIFFSFFLLWLYFIIILFKNEINQT